MPKHILFIAVMAGVVAKSNVSDGGEKAKLLEGGLTTMQTLQTSRLVIRPFTAEDWSGFQKLAENYNSSDGGKYEGKWSTSEKHCKGSVDYMSKKDTYFAVCRRDTRELIGMLVLNSIDASKQLDLGYIIHARYQDNDHDKEALEAMISYVFREKGARSIVARWRPEWTEQFAVLQTLGGEVVDGKKGEMVLAKEKWEQGHGKTVSANTGPRPVYDVPFLNKFTVDGDPAEWDADGLRVRLAGVNRDERRLVPEDDIDVSFRLGWTDEGLAVLVEVRDDEFVEDPFDHRLGQGDHFALNVADSVEGRNLVRVLVTPGLAADQPELRYAVQDRRSKDLRSVPAEARVARTKRVDGYVAEVLVPWPVLGVTPERGRQIGFQLQMRDWDEAGPNAIVTWFPYLRNWRSGDNLHALRLWTAASPPFEQTAVASVDYEDLRRARYRVGCRGTDAGKTVTVLSRGKVLAQATARAEGDSAVAHLEGAYPQVGSEDEVQEIQIGDHLGATASVRTRAGRRIAAAMRKPAFARHVFSEEAFPPCAIGQDPDVREWLGECAVTVQHYDAKYRPVDQAAGLGRYGAMVTVTPGREEALRLYRTLWRADGETPPGGDDPLADALWWAGLKAAVGLPEETVLDGFAEWDEVGGEFAGQFYRPARVLTRALEFLGDRARSPEIMSVSGASWRLLWHEGQWQRGISAMYHFGHLVEEHRVFEAIGREYLFLGKQGTSSGKGYTEDQMRAIVCREIDGGRPVIACGVGDSQELIVVGYRKAGSILVVAWGAGRDSYRDVANWAKGEHFAGFHLIGATKPAPSDRDKLIAALKVAVSMARTPQVNGRACGLAAYDAWARDLLKDKHFPAKDTESLRRVAWCSGEAALAHVDARLAAIKYLRSSQEHVGERAWKHLEAAASLHEKEWDAVMSRHDFMPWGGEKGDHLIAVTTRGSREALAKGVLGAKEYYGRAIEQIEKALEAEGVDL